MFGIFARTFHTATRQPLPNIEERRMPVARLWDAPQHWTEVEARQMHEKADN